MRTVAGIAAFTLTALAAAGVLLYRHFVTERIMDGGDMTNPFLSQEEVSPLLPEEGELVSLLWLRNAMSYDDSYSFSLSGGPDAPVLACSFAEENRNAGDRPELGGDDPKTGEQYAPVPVSRARWEQTERLLRETSLPAYQPPEANLSDAETDRIDVTWREANGTERSAAFDGTDAAPLLALLKEIAREAALEQ